MNFVSQLVQCVRPRSAALNQSSAGFLRVRVIAAVSYSLAVAVLVAANAQPAHATEPSAGRTPDGSTAAKAMSPSSEAPVTATTRLAESVFARGDALPAWARPLRPVPPKKRDDSYVLRLAQTQFWIGPKPVVLVHRVMQANQSAGLGQLGQIPIQFIPAYQRVSLHALKVQRGDELTDRTGTVSIRFLDTEPALDQGVYSGGAVANLLLDDVRVGDIVHITYSINGANPVMQDYFNDSASWDRTEGTDLRVVEVVAPRGRGVDWKMVGGGAAAVVPKVIDDNGNTVTTFEQSDLAPVDDEPQLPSEYLSARFLQLSSFRSWNEVARWAAALFPPVTTLPPELQQVLADARKLPTPEARVAHVLHWVQSEIRYFSVSFGESSHRPYAPGEVITRRYGDCKDKSYLLVTLLRALDIDARPLLVSMRSPRGARLLLPTPHAFDHVIVDVRIGEQRYQIDGTRFAQPPTVPLAMLTPAMPNAQALPAVTDAYTLIDLPSAPPKLAVNELDERIEVKSFDDPPTLVATSVMSGMMAEIVRYSWQQMTPEQRARVANAGYEKRYPGAKPLDAPALNDDPAGNRVTVVTRLTLPNAIREREGDRGISYTVDNFNGFFNLPEKPGRKSPALVAALPSLARYRLTVVWPDNVSRMLDPVVTATDNAFFRGDIDRQFRGNTYSLRASIEAKVMSVEAGQLATLRDELRKFENGLGTISFVPASSVQARGFLGLGKSSIEQRLRRDYQRTVEGTTSAIKGGKLSGEDLADAYCERGIAYFGLDDHDAAGADLDLAVKTAPAVGGIYSCRGELRFNTGDFVGAIADFSKALTLGAKPGDAYYRRGQARYHAGQYEAAAADLARGADAKFTAEGAGAAHYAQLWQIWALQRAGQAIPDKLMTQAKAEADGAWPRSAIAMMVGLKTPEQILAEINALAGDEREMNLSEAWFYVGQYWLSRGNTDEARKAFEACRRQGVLMYIEHIAAAHELKRITK